MKFGETLYQRSVQKWAAYNVKYNELKHLIKERTSQGNAVPVAIPAAGVHRWQNLEDDLFSIIQDEHSNVSLFLRSKQGEIERRLIHLEKQVKSAQRAVDNGPLDRPILQARKYQRLVKDADSIGEELDLISRFSGVQKTAFRKILKKYRKWTGSTALQERLNVQVFSSGALQFDYVEYRNRLSSLSRAINDLAAPMLTGHQQSADRRRPSMSGHAPNRSNAKDIAVAASQGQLQLDVALESVPYGEVSGSRYYWIHPDNLDEAESLLLRNMHLLGDRPSLKTLNIAEPNGGPPKTDQTHLAVYDNVQRYIQDSSTLRPSNMAVTVRWTDQQDGLVTLSSMIPKSTDIDIIPVKRKDLGVALQRATGADGTSTPRAKQYVKTRSYLSEHRDVKPLAEVHSIRSRYAGNTNSTEVGTWATLDSSVSFSPVATSELGMTESTVEAGEAFPHTVLHIRWEFSRMPEVVRLFDTSHLAERVQDFSLEKAAVYTICKDLDQPRWRQSLAKDIRKVPAALRRNRVKSRDLPVQTSSGPSSTEGATDSVFSVGGRGQSSATSTDQSPNLSYQEIPAPEASKPGLEAKDPPQKKKKRARIVTPAEPERRPPPQRYWNEFDDGDSDVNQDESYAIYIDPDEPSFPGAETVSRVFGSMYDSLSRGKMTVASWFPMSAKEEAQADGVRTPLLFNYSKQQHPSEADLESSGSDTDEFINQFPKRVKKRRLSSASRSSEQKNRRPLSRRRKALERTLFQFYTGLIAVSYVLLIMAGILENSGRKKKVLEVDAGVVAGVAVAEACAVTSIIFICMRRRPLSALHWGTVLINVTVIVLLGIAELAIMFARS